MATVTLNSIVSSTNRSCTRESRSKALLLVNRLPVWDYKIQDKQLRVISEPYNGLDSTEYVTFGELTNYVNKEFPEGRDMPIVSETDGKTIETFEVLLGENEQLLIDLI